MSLVLGKAEEDRLRRVRRYVGDPSRNRLGDLYRFCVEILGYDALSETFHGPMLRAWDRVDLRRFRIYMGLEQPASVPIDTLDLWPRGHIKTWCKRAQIIRYYLWNPATTVTWWHAVEDKAIETGQAIGDTLQQNKELRRLFPDGVLPAMNRKKFVSGGCFNLGGRRIGDGASFMALGAGAEGTGGHSLVGVLDDFIGWNDVVDSQMEKKKQFYRATVRNVVLRTNQQQGWVDGIGTHWDQDDPYSEWEESSDWVVTLRACLETDGKPDYKGTPVYLSQEQIEKERREQGEVMFAYQMMNDKSPKGAKAWDPQLCEHFVPLETVKGPGTMFCLSDPAPANIGSFKDMQAKTRGDGTKNEWAICIVKLRTNGDRREVILLDGDASKAWDLNEGYRRIFTLMRKWGCSRLAEEQTGQAIALYEKTRRDVARTEGARYQAVKLENTYQGQAKKMYFGALCSKAKNDEVLIADSLPESFKEGLMDQLRRCIFFEGGRNNLKLDDRMNVFSFCTDPALRNNAPDVAPDKEWSPFTKPPREDELGGSRYIQW